MSSIFFGESFLMLPGICVRGLVGLEVHLSLTLSFGLRSLACQADTHAMLLCAHTQAHMEHHIDPCVRLIEKTGIFAQSFKPETDTSMET